MTRGLLALVTLAFVSSAPVAALARPFTFDDFARVQSVSGPAISPDGTRVVFTLSSPDMKKDDTIGELMLLDVADGSVRPLTQHREHVGDAHWSPDGTKVSFVAEAGEGKMARPQVWVLPMNGGDPHPVTMAPNGVESYAWRPDGGAIAYVTSDDAKDKARIDKQNDLFTVGDQDYLAKSAPVSSHLWLVAIDGGKAKRLTSGAWTIDSAPSWSADGAAIAFGRLPDAYRGRGGHEHAAVLTLATGAITDLTNAATFSADPIFAHAGHDLVYAVGHENLWSFQHDYFVKSADGVAHQIAPNLDRNLNAVGWLPDDSGLLVSADDHTSVALWRAPLNGTPERLDLGDVNVRGASVAKNGAIAFAGSSSKDASEIYYVAPGANVPKRMTKYNASLAALDLGETSEFTWKNGGFDEDGVLTYPAQYQKGKKYPLVLLIHGGPSGSASSAGFSAFVQVLAGRGYVVLQPNYRCSDNLGFAYGRAWLDDPVEGAGTDIVAGVKALEAAGIVDPSRVGVSGWSGGGWMTSWLITHYHLWKAAVSGAAVDDAVLEYELNDVFDYLPSLMNGASPWKGDGHAKYVKASPITYVANVTTPTLILSDTQDYRVPTPQAYEFYHALKENGKTVEFVAIPAYGHFPSDPVRVRETYRTWAAWMDKYVR